jgi:opacity protein-like surface antigen
MKSPFCVAGRLPTLCRVATVACLFGFCVRGIVAQTAGASQFAQSSSGTSAVADSHPIFDLAVKVGALGRTSTADREFNGNSSVGVTSALIGFSGGIRFPTSPTWSVGGRASLLLPVSSTASAVFPNTGGRYVYTKLQVAGTFEFVLTAKLPASTAHRPLAVYGTFGGAMGPEQYGSTVSGFSDTETMFGFTGSGGAEATLTPHVTLFAEIGYMDMSSGKFHASLEESTPFKLKETGISGTVGFRYHFR